MYALPLQIPATVSTVTAAIERFESAVYRADAVFQAQVVPRVYHAFIIAAHIFIQAAIATYVFGVRCACWYTAYNAASVPAVSTVDTVEPQLALSGAAPMLLLPAETEFHAGRIDAAIILEARWLRRCNKVIYGGRLASGVDVLITPPAADAIPAPKPATKRRQPLNSATTPEVARKNATKVAGPRGKKVSID